LIYTRKLLLDKAIEMDVSIFTPSDFCVMGTNIFFEDYTQEGMEREIREYLRTNYDINEFVYLNPTFNISNYYEVAQKINELNK
jgi:hypothetical protein